MKVHDPRPIGTARGIPRFGCGNTPALLLVFAMLGSSSFAQDGEETTVSLSFGAGKDGKPSAPVKSTCWLPAGCKYVRGIVVAHPMIKEPATSPLFRKVAAEEGLGTVLTSAFGPSGKESIENFDKIFDQWAETSKHPEIRGAAVFTAGLSTSVLWARNLGYAVPDRVFGILHTAGGNLHQHMNDERKTLTGVPFIAMNGQFESCGPEGGIRPHLELETQWYLMGDTMLERRKQDPNNLMSLVVIPCKGHTAWNHTLGALFLRKAAQYRLPKEKRDGATPAKCVQLKAEDGWLTDRDVKYPKHEPAPYAEYKGDKLQAFWHFDKEMALAVCQYHKDGIRPGQDWTVFRPAGLFEDLWPLGERMDIPFKEHSPEAYAAALREWIGKKTGNKLSAEVVKYVADGMAQGLKKEKDKEVVDEGACHHHCQRVCYAYDDLYRPIAQAIDKADLPAESKAMLRTLYGEQMLVLVPNGRLMPELPVRAIQELIAALPAGAKPEAVTAMIKADSEAARAALVKLYGAAVTPKPENLDKLLADLGQKDSKAAWAAVDELVKIGAPAIPSLVRLADYAGAPVDFRAAAGLGRMSNLAKIVLPELRRTAQRGSRFSEMDATLCYKTLEAIPALEKAAGL